MSKKFYIEDHQCSTLFVVYGTKNSILVIWYHQCGYSYSSKMALESLWEMLWVELYCSRIVKNLANRHLGNALFLRFNAISLQLSPMLMLWSANCSQLNPPSTSTTLLVHNSHWFYPPTPLSTRQICHITLFLKNILFLSMSSKHISKLASRVSKTRVPTLFSSSFIFFFPFYIFLLFFFLSPSSCHPTLQHVPLLLSQTSSMSSYPFLNFKAP